ncbi:MAG: ribonuclease E/G, partial [Phycisphaerae bacterium]
EELFIERASTQSHGGNIYKGRVTNVEPSIQAVFVDFGLAKNGFLHISDVQPQYFPERGGESEDVGRKIPRHSRPPIQRCFRRGQEVIVQVTKEGVGTKGPTLTTYLSIPGRFLVMMPGMNRQGVSRRIEDETDRQNMRDLLRQLKLPAGMGFILRTAGLGQSKRELQRDLNYLLRLWKRVVDRIKRLPAPTELYQESDLVKRTVRDVYTGDFNRLIVDDPETATKVREFLKIAMPRTKVAIEVYSEREPLFHRLGIEEEIDRIQLRQVPLPSGGSIVIDATEALVAIDVNSGRFRSVEDAEESAFRINLEAADEIARQLRLRDLGGLIICDFIDMRHDGHQRAVERALRDALKKHKERARVLRMSAFGLIEMTRQRQGPSYKRNIFFDCPHCKGAGVVKMPESVMLDVMRFIQLATHNEQVRTVKVTVAADVAFQILNNKRRTLSQIEIETGKEVLIFGDSSFTSDQMEHSCEDARGRPVAVGRTSINAPTPAE